MIRCKKKNDIPPTNKLNSFTWNTINGVSQILVSIYNLLSLPVKYRTNKEILGYFQ